MNHEVLKLVAAALRTPECYKCLRFWATRIGDLGDAAKPCVHQRPDCIEQRYCKGCGVLELINMEDD